MIFMKIKVFLERFNPPLSYSIGMETHNFCCPGANKLLGNLLLATEFIYYFLHNFKLGSDYELYSLLFSQQRYHYLLEDFSWVWC